MLLLVLAVLLTLGIAFYQATQGLFSALIMALATLVCTLLAFNFYEPLAAMIYSDPARLWAHAAAEAVMLVALLVVPLLGLRLLLDRYLGVNIVPGLWVNRVGGFLLGLVTAQLLTGTLLIAVQMLPFPRSILFYDAYDDNLKPADSMIAQRWTLGLVGLLSRGSMSPVGAGGASFEQMHDDLILELWGTRNRPEGARASAPPGAVSVQAVYDVSDAPYPGAPRETFLARAPFYRDVPLEDCRVLLVRVQVKDTAADQDHWWRLPGTQFRLAMQDGLSCYPVAYLTHVGVWEVQTSREEADQPDRLGKLLIQRPADAGGADGLMVDLLYRVPNRQAGASSEPRKPAFLAFRRIAKADVPEVQILLDESNRASMPEQTPFTMLDLRKQKTRGSAKVVLPPEGTPDAVTLFRPEEAHIRNRMPTGFRSSAQGGSTVTEARGVQGQLDDNRRFSGTISASAAALDFGGHNVPWIGEFSVPQGHRMVQLVGSAPQSQATQTVNVGGVALQPMVTVRLKNNRTARYRAVGGWALWTEGNNASAVYTIYQPELLSTEPPAAGQFGELVSKYSENRARLQRQGFGLIFLVPGDSEVIGFTLAGGQGSEMLLESPLDVESSTSY